MSISSDFLLGVVVSEGCFYIPLYHKSSGNVRPAVSFSVKMNDRELLEKMKDEVGVGNMTNKCETPVWQVQSEEDCKSLVDYIEQNRNRSFGICHKSKQYDKWCEALELLDGKANTRVDDEVKKRLVDLSFSISESRNGRSTEKSEWYDRIDNE